MRIASLVPSATEMLFALGLGESVVAVTHECDYPAEAQGLPHLTRTVLPAGLGAGEIDRAVKARVGEGRALYELDEELLAELAPDLIVTQAVCAVCAVSYEDVRRGGRAAGGPAPGRPTGPEHPGRDARGRDPARRGDRDRAGTRTSCAASSRAGWPRSAPRSAAPAAPRVVALEWLDPPYVGGHWVPEMISIAGGEDVAGPPGLKSPEVSWGELSGLNPDVVVAMPCGWYVEESRAQALAQWERSRRSAPRRSSPSTPPRRSRGPGPRLVDGVELLGHLFHPDLVDAPGNIGFAELRGPARRG